MAECEASVEEGSEVMLLCDLPAGHDGKAHLDRQLGCWWYLDDGEGPDDG